MVCADVNEAGARETADLVNGKGSQALALKVDVTSRMQVDTMVTRAIARLEIKKIPSVNDIADDEEEADTG